MPGARRSRPATDQRLSGCPSPKYARMNGAVLLRGGGRRPALDQHDVRRGTLLAELQERRVLGAAIEAPSGLHGREFEDHEPLEPEVAFEGVEFAAAHEVAPAGDPDLDLHFDRPARVADLAADLLAHRAALLLGERRVLLPHVALAPLHAAEVCVERREPEGQGLRGDLHLAEARRLELRAQTRLVSEREEALGLRRLRGHVPGDGAADQPAHQRAVGPGEDRDGGAPARPEHAAELGEAARRVGEEHQPEAA